MTPRAPRFRSALDVRLVGAIAVLLGWTVPAGVWLVARGLFAAGVVLAVGGLLPLAIFLPVRYVVDAQVLRIRSGIFRWQIPYPLIVRVEPVRGSAAAPALSRRRLSILFETGDGLDTVQVSPKRRAAFLAALRDAAPHAEIEEKPEA